MVSIRAEPQPSATPVGRGKFKPSRTGNGLIRCHLGHFSDPVPALAIRPRLQDPAQPASQDDVKLAAKGDRRAFERLYRANLDRVFSVCVRMVADRLRAEELTQDIFVRAWEKLGSFRGESAFSTWLHRLAVNHILNERK